MRVLVVGGGPPPLPSALPQERFDLVIAVDSGFDHARAMGLSVDVLVGDLDSVSVTGLRAAERAGVTIERHPAEKDWTDLELGLHRALSAGASSIVYLAGRGGRLDHELVGLLHLASPEYATVAVTALVASTRVDVARAGSTLALTGAAVGSLVSVLPVGGDAVVSLSGLRYPLERRRMSPTGTLGVSNEVAEQGAEVTVHEGVVLVVH
ncbi:MAG: thiamine diphosphokinase [Acidimicrobiia bacterium]